MVTQKQFKAEGHFVLQISLSILILSQKGPKQITVPDESSYTLTALFRKGKLYTHSSPSPTAKERTLYSRQQQEHRHPQYHPISTLKNFPFISLHPKNKPMAVIWFKCNLSTWEVITKNHLVLSSYSQSSISSTPRQFMKLGSFLHM